MRPLPFLLFTAAFQNLIVFKNSDYESRKFITERLGINFQAINAGFMQENIPIQREGHTVEDWELNALGLGDALICLRGEAPFLFKMPLYEEA